MNQLTLNYGKLIRTSWDIVKKRPYLWILGILSGAGGGGLNFGNFSSSDFSDSKKTSFNSAKQWFGEVAGASTDKWQHYVDTGVITTIVILTLVLIILLIILSVIFRGGLIKSVINISKGIEGNFSKAWHLGLKTWKALFGLNIVILLAFVAGAMPIVLFIALATISSTMKIIAIISGILWVILYLILILAISLTYPFMERILILDGVGALASIFEGVNFFKKHWKEGLILYALNIGLALGYIIFLVLAVLILAIPTALIYFAFNAIATPVAIVFLVVIITIVLILLLIAQGFFGALTSTIYTGAYVALKAHFIH